MGTTRFQEACAQAYGAGELVAKAWGITLFSLPSLSEWLQGRGLTSWLSLHNDLVPGTMLRHEVAKAISEELAEWDEGQCYSDTAEYAGGDEDMNLEEVVATIRRTVALDKASPPHLSLAVADSRRELIVLTLSEGEMGTWLLVSFPPSGQDIIGKLTCGNMSVYKALSSGSCWVMLTASDMAERHIEVISQREACAHDLLAGYFMVGTNGHLPDGVDMKLEPRLKPRARKPRNSDCPRCGGELIVKVKNYVEQTWEGPGDCSGEVLEYIDSTIMSVQCMDCHAEWDSSRDDELTRTNNA